MTHATLLWSIWQASLVASPWASLGPDTAARRVDHRHVSPNP